jgi:hypothetical protein
VGVTLQHPQFLVPANRGDLDDVEPALEQARHGFVPEIMKMQISASGALAEVLPGQPHSIATYWKYALVVAFIVQGV